MPKLICAECGRAFIGRVDARYCSDRCRSGAWRKRHPNLKSSREIALELRGLPEDELRRLVKDEMAARYPAGGRFRVRFGPYHPEL